jgi:hypothetical protein
MRCTVEALQFKYPRRGGKINRHTGEAKKVCKGE